LFTHTASFLGQSNICKQGRELSRSLAKLASLKLACQYSYFASQSVTKKVLIIYIRIERFNYPRYDWLAEAFVQQMELATAKLMIEAYGKR
jgi:hypothetical protein